MRSSRALIEKLRGQPDAMLKILQDRNLSAEVQISDINAHCWAVVELVMNIQTFVFEELNGTEDDSP